MGKCAIKIFCICTLCLILAHTSLAAVLPFSDVGSDSWFYQDVQYVYQKGLMNGTAAATFEPDGRITRGMIVTILHRLEGTPPVSAACPFDDVGSLRYDRKAITWAASHGIVNGYTLTRFAPDDPLARQQFAAILYRFSAFKGYDTTQRADLSSFVDADQISAYAVENLSWANAKGLINGTSAGELLPTGYATRAQSAAILARFCRNIAESAENTQEIVPEKLENTEPDSNIPETDEGQLPENNETQQQTPDDAQGQSDANNTDNPPANQTVSGRNTGSRRSSGVRNENAPAPQNENVSVSKDENVFRIAAEQSPDGKTVEITVTLEGTVHLCGFDMSLQYETPLFSLSSLNTSHDMDIVSAVDSDAGTVAFNYAGVKNVTKSKTILTSSFDVIGDSGQTGSFILIPEEVVETDERNNVTAAGYNLISQTVDIR